LHLLGSMTLMLTRRLTIGLIGRVIFSYDYYL
jgi:hypothetical protein